MTEPTEDTIRCRRCRREVTSGELDRILWCDECVAGERGSAAGWGRVIGVAGVALLGAYILLAIRPGPDFRILWLIVLAVAYGLISRLGAELVFGVRRVRNRAGARAPDAGA